MAVNTAIIEDWETAEHTEPMQKNLNLEGTDQRNPVLARRPHSSLHHAPEFGSMRPSEEVPMHLKVISDMGVMDRIEHSWNQLMQSDASPYQAFGWVQAFFHHWNEWIDEMLVFTLTGRQGIVAILPCYRIGAKLHLAADEISPYNDMVAEDRAAAAELVARAGTWVREYRNGYKFHFRSVREESLIHDAVRRLVEDEEGWTCIARDAGGSDSFHLEGGSESYLESLSETGEIRLRQAGAFFNQKFPMDRLTVLRGCELRVNDLANAFEFFARCKAEGADLPELDFQLFSALGEASKDCDLGMQLASLSNEGEILAVSCGFAMNGVWHEYLRAEAEEHARFEPAANLFIRCIERWHREDGLSTCSEMGTGIPASGEIERERANFLSITLKPDTKRHRLYDRLLGRGGVEDSDDSDIFLAR